MSEYQKIKNGGLDQYGAEHFKCNQFWHHWAWKG